MNNIHSAIVWMITFWLSFGVMLFWGLVGGCKLRETVMLVFVFIILVAWNVIRQNMNPMRKNRVSLSNGSE